MTTEVDGPIGREIPTIVVYPRSFIMVIVEDLKTPTDIVLSITRQLCSSGLLNNKATDLSPSETSKRRKNMRDIDDHVVLSRRKSIVT